MSYAVDTLLHNATVYWEPYPHLVKENALPETTYRDLAETRLADNVIRAGREGDNTRADIPTRFLKGIGVWDELIGYCTSRHFVRDVAAIFGSFIKGYYPWLDLWTGSVGVRKTGEYDIATECQIGVNTPCPVRSRVVGPHLDNPKELYAGLLYMRGDDEPDGGDLEVLRYIKPPRFEDKRRLPDDYTEVVRTIPYRANTFVLFINTPESIHSVSPRGPCEQYRRLVNIIGEARKPLFEVPYA